MNRLDLLILAANPVGHSSAPGVRDLVGPDGSVTIPSTDPLQLDREIRQIRRIVEGGRYRDLVDVDTHLAVNPDDLLPLLRRRSANVVHFCGHSTERGIVLADDHNAPVLVSKEAFVRVIRAVGSKVELILLNSCTGMEIARSLAEVCGCAIGMRDKIGDRAAWTFSRAFYEAFADGVPVQEAVEHGRTALALWGMREEDLPDLLCREGVDPSKLALSGAQVARPVTRKTRKRPMKEPGAVGPDFPRKERSEQPVPLVSTALATPAPTVNSIGMKLVLIPAGEFLMGSPDSDPEADPAEKPQHLVRITRPFLLGKYPVTQAEYKRATGEGPSHFKGQPENPVESVSWYEAIRFCNALSERENLEPYYTIAGEDVGIPDAGGAGYRLPTEAEWEYACRAGTETRYSFGDDEADLGEYAWYDKNSDGKVHPVGEKRPNAWGLHDMHGNVWEWCWDAWDAYKKSDHPVDDPAGPPIASSQENPRSRRSKKRVEASEAELQAPVRVVRGGCWRISPRELRSADRDGGRPGDRFNLLGFRVARGQSGG
jgi:formylglycine-generating enzyme required for sulfatase activity